MTFLVAGGVMFVYPMTIPLDLMTDVSTTNLSFSSELETPSVEAICMRVACGSCGHLG